MSTTNDAVIVGAGPIGIELAALFTRAGISFVHLEAGPIGATITRWPRNTRFFSSPEWIAIAGIPIQTDGQEMVTGERYLAYLRQVVEIFDLPVRTYEEVTDIRGARGDFTVQTCDLAGRDHRYHAAAVVLATGDMNRPRFIGVPGEDLPHVTHLWQDPHLYFQRELLIVGGHNSAVEAAIRCWRAGAKVSMSYRGEALSEKKLISRLFLEIDLLIRNGQVRFYPGSVPMEIRPGVTVLGPARELPAAGVTDPGAPDTGGSGLPQPAGRFPVAADFVYLATGFEMDQRLYSALGVRVEGEERKPVHDPATMETNVPGVYVAGTAVGGNQRGYKVFITTSHDHCLRIARAFAPVAAIPDSWVGNHPSRDYPLSSRDVE